MVTSEAGSNEIRQVSVTSIVPNPFQPRHYLSESDLADLASSIKEHGILQPLIGRPESNGTYTLIAGHRRWKAAVGLGQETVPLIPHEDASDEDLRLLALIENIQREDLQVVDKARALAELADRYPTQQAAAQALGMRRDALAQWLRVRQLNPEVLDICFHISGLTLKNLLQLVKLPENKRVSSARFLLAQSQSEETEKKESTSSASRNNLRLFQVRHSKKKMSFTVAVRSRSRKQTVTDEDFREALLQALASFENRDQNPQ